MSRSQRRREAWEAILGRSRRPQGEAEPDAGFLGIRFDCCDVYARIYRNEDRTFYEGRCPRCLRRVRVRIGPGGSSERFFRAS